MKLVIQVEWGLFSQQKDMEVGQFLITRISANTGGLYGVLAINTIHRFCEFLLEGYESDARENAA